MVLFVVVLLTLAVFVANAKKELTSKLHEAWIMGKDIQRSKHFKYLYMICRETPEGFSSDILGTVNLPNIKKFATQLFGIMFILFAIVPESTVPEGKLH